MKNKSTNRLIGYARVSTNGQGLKLQLDALERAGCPKKLIFVDKVSGAKTARPGLDKCLGELREGDTLVVWRLDRLGRSVRHLIDLVEQLRQRKVGFKSLCDGAIDTTTASGELIFNVFACLSQFERRLIQERTRAGLEAHRGGRPTGPDGQEDARRQVALHRRHLPDPADFQGDLLPVSGGELSLTESHRRIILRV